MSSEAVNDHGKIHHSSSISNLSSLKNLTRPSLTSTPSTPNLLNSSNDLTPTAKDLPEKKHSHLYQPASFAEVEGYDLLDWFNNRQSDQYRDIEFVIPEDRPAASITKNEYEKRVSFDTIDFQCDDDNDFDDYYDDHDDPWRSERGRGTERDMRSPSVSPSRHFSVPSSRTMSSPNRNSGDLSLEIGRFLSQSRVDYPTRPIITHRGCTFSKLHHQFEDLYLGKIPDRKPILPNRVILVYVSARKHTWVALDWILNSFVEDGDTVIVVSAIHSNQLMRRRPTRGNIAPSTAMTPKMRLRQRNRPEFMKVIAKNVMTYIMEVINPAKITRVSVELAVGKTKDVLKEMYKLYEPNLVCIGSKQNLRISAPLKSWLSSRISDRLVKNFPLPVIVVPAMNMNKYEQKLADSIHARYGVEVPKEEQDIVNDREDSENNDKTEDTKTFSDDAGSINSTESMSSESSTKSYSSYEEISRLYIDYKQEIHDNIKILAKQPINEDFYATFVKMVSDKSNALCENIRDVDPDFRGKGAKLARAITGSNSFGMVMHKSKSLLEPVNKSKSETPGSGLSYKEIKKNLQRNALEREKSGMSPPQISVDPPSKQASPDTTTENRKSSLKFVNLETPTDQRSRQNDESEEPEPKSRKSTKSLMKSLSHDLERKTSRPKLKPLSSHPDITSHLNGNGSQESVAGSDGVKPKKSRMKKFWKLFS